MRLLFTVALFLSIKISSSQNTTQINVKITPLINNQVNNSYSNIDSISINQLKFYLTNFSLIKSKNTVWKEDKSYHLIDLSDTNTFSFLFNLLEKIDFDEIHFLLGTDSLTNVSGVMGGDLDPTKGMYWAWNSGYINFKIEGERNTIPFEFHIGGYAPPYQSVQKIKLKTINNESLNIRLNINKFIHQLNINDQNKILSPGKEAQKLSLMLSNLFSINE